MMNEYINNPVVTDVTQISRYMDGLRALSMALSMGLLMFLVPLEALRQTFRGIGEKANLYGMAARIGLVVVGLLLYQRIFDFITHAAFMMEASVLSVDEWAKFLDTVARFAVDGRPGLLRSSLPLVFAWIASFLAVLFNNVLYWVRYALLSFLYFVGPLAFTAAVFEPARYLAGGWFRNVIQLSLWTVALKIIVRIMLTLQTQVYLSQAIGNEDIVTIVGINATFLVMVFLSPMFVMRFMSGDTLGPIATMAATYLTTKTVFAGRQVMGAALRPMAPRMSGIPAAVPKMASPAPKRSPETWKKQR